MPSIVPCGCKLYCHLFQDPYCIHFPQHHPKTMHQQWPVTKNFKLSITPHLPFITTCMALITAAGTSEILIFITPGCFLGLISSALIRSISSLSITAEHLGFVVYCVNEKLCEIAHWLQLMWHDFPSMQVYSVTVLPCWSVWLNFDGSALQYGL